jgi:hypothetical protein
MIVSDIFSTLFPETWHLSYSMVPGGFDTYYIINRITASKLLKIARGKKGC